MATQFDASDFVDSDYQAAASAAKTAANTPPPPASARPPTREEIEGQVSETQNKLSELKRLEEQLERTRAALEEARRRQSEFHTGREEMVQSLVRGIGLLEAAEFASRRDAEQMAKTLGDLREAQSKVQSIHDETWTKDSYNTELTKALTTIENARMEWNSARLKWPLLAGNPASSEEPIANAPLSRRLLLEQLSMGQLCKFGLALTWPLLLVALAALAVFTVVLFRR